MTAVADCAYPGIDDFLAFDPGTGRLAHLHLHRQLVLGERRVKSYRLPWEDWLLATRRMDEEHAVQVADPHMELLLLVIRAALKLRARDLVRSIVPGAALPGGMEREYRWLLERVERAQLVERARPLVGERAAAVLGALTDGPPSVWQLLNFRRAVKPRLGTYRTYGSAAAARTEGWRREWRTRWNSLRRQRLGSPVPSKRTIPHGIVLVFIGCDGSGKSTMTKEVTRWLAWKLDVLPVYFGSGDGPASLLRRPLRLGKAVRRLQARGLEDCTDGPRARFRNLRQAPEPAHGLVGPCPGSREEQASRAHPAGARPGDDRHLRPLSRRHNSWGSTMAPGSAPGSSIAHGCCGRWPDGSTTPIGWRRSSPPIWS